MQTVFGSEGLGIWHWLAIITASIALFLVVELEKMVLRRRSGGTSPRSSRSGDRARKPAAE